MEVIRLSFKDMHVPFVSIGVSGTTFVGPRGDMLYRINAVPEKMHYVEKPDTDSINYRLNRDLILEARDKARKLLLQAYPNLLD